MRVSLQAMLIFSIALHLGVATEIFFSQRPSSTPVTSAIETSVPSMTLMPEKIIVPKLSPRAIKPAAILTQPTPSLPVPVQPTTDPDAIAILPKTSVPHESNPNQHAPAARFEAVLCPIPAPELRNGDGIVFVLDVSGSMYEPYSGSTRLALARAALAQRIQSLKDSTPFAITIYGQTARNSGPLVAASSITREAAIRYITQDYDCGGGTNLPGGLACAEMLHPGAILVVTDGDLNISPIELLSSAHKLFADPGQGPSLVVLAIAPRPETKARALLKGLADQQGGTYLTADSDGPAELITSAKAESTSR